jgi:hypothetical protein
MVRITTSLMIAFGLIAFATVHNAMSQEPVSNHCKNRVEADCNAAVACKWRSVTENNGPAKTSCVYDAKAGRAILAAQFGVN